MGRHSLFIFRMKVQVFSGCPRVGFRLCGLAPHAGAGTPFWVLKLPLRTRFTRRPCLCVKQNQSGSLSRFPKAEPLVVGREFQGGENRNSPPWRIFASFLFAKKGRARPGLRGELTKKRISSAAKPHQKAFRSTNKENKARTTLKGELTKKRISPVAKLHRKVFLPVNKKMGAGSAPTEPRSMTSKKKIKFFLQNTKNKMKA